MKKIILIFLLGLLFLIPNSVEAKNINIYLFYGNGCPHCADMEAYLKEYLKDNKDVKLKEYEIWYNSNNQKLWQKVQNKTEVEATGIPYLVVGEKVIQGYLQGYTNNKIDEYIDYCRNNSYIDKAGIALGLVKETPKQEDTKQEEPKQEENNNKNENKYNLPVFGEITAKEVSIPLLAIVIGFVDGFNPCAMWILIFLISMLFTMKEKRKMWILGLTFILTSGFVYLLFMMSWLNLAMFANKVTIIRTIIAVFAIAFGLYNIYRYFKTKEIGCDVVDTTKRKKIMTSIKRIVNNKTFILALIGIIILAIGVNIIELLCSLGLPVIFTEILSLNDINNNMKLIYLLIYVFFFILDDLIIFIIAMKSLKIKAISNKYTKYSHLIGGIIMFILGLLMIIKPEWIMFNF